MDNLSLWNTYKTAPEEAKKKITGGRLNGMTDINPMWRIRCLTEAFGPCGAGWYYTIDKTELVPCGDELAVFVFISLFVREGEGWSKPISGNGGSSLYVKERSGLRMDDEAYKKATTDALSVACKELGIGADVYWEKGASYGTKYEPRRQEPQTPTIGKAGARELWQSAEDLLGAEKALRVLEEAKQTLGVGKLEDITLANIGKVHLLITEEAEANG